MLKIKCCVDHLRPPPESSRQSQLVRTSVHSQLRTFYGHEPGSAMPSKGTLIRCRFAGPFRGNRVGKGDMTAQFSDTLNFEGMRYSLLTNPLNGYFEQNPPRPNFAARTTANWRGYIASWDIRANRLRLTGLSGDVCTRETDKSAVKSSWCPVGHHGDCAIEKVGLGHFFTSPTGVIFADWVTEELRLPAGNMVKYIHMGYESKFERYLMISIKEGVVVGTRIIGSEDFEKEQEEY